MSSEESLEHASELICTEFSLVPIPARLDSPETAQDALRRVLAHRIAEMLRFEYERLLAALYRIDVSEAKAAEALRERETEVAADRLAQLIIERQLEKLESRRRRRHP